MWLGKGASRGLTIYLGPEGGDIVTCRVTRMSQDFPLIIIDPVFCCECGASDLGVCDTSKTLGPHLCPTCAVSKVEYDIRKEIRAGLSMREQPVA
jgi:hypothetical protein